MLSVDGKLLFGGHPMITPLVLMIAMEHHARDSVDVFQSRWFDDKITPETRRLADSGIGTIHLTPRCDDLADSLLTMRMRMVRFDRPVGAVFVGGMDGIVEEHELVGKMLPGIPRIPLKGPGGAAARLPVDGEVPRSLARRLGSRSYPLVASEIVDFLSTLGPVTVASLVSKARAGGDAKVALAGAAPTNGDADADAAADTDETPESEPAAEPDGSSDDASTVEDESAPPSE